MNWRDIIFKLTWDEVYKLNLVSMLAQKSLIRAKDGEVFQLASGKTSSYYLDVKKTALTSEGHFLLGNIINDSISRWRGGGIEYVAGVALGGVSLASAVSTLTANSKSPLEALYIRKESKSHGTKNLIEGNFIPGKKIILLEDVVTSGQSSLKAAEVLAYAGGIVAGIIAVVDRLEGAQELFNSQGIPFFALVTIEEIMKYEKL